MNNPSINSFIQGVVIVIASNDQQPGTDKQANHYWTRVHQEE